MPFMKYARANVVHPEVSRAVWASIRAAEGGTTAKVAAKKTKGKVSGNLVEQASSIFGSVFNPENYLLTHATIVCSVDTTSPTGVKTGHVLEDGFRINRKYADFRVKPDTQKYINNNRDAWSRGVILKAFDTFIGGHNFVEHVQIEEQSKGRIIDAVARDIGESVYIDILIATDRKHTDLVKAIQSGKMATLSMGCTVDGTICTKCGHWAADETEMCPHIKYEKGNTFFNEAGRQTIVAELCGHESIEPTGGVTFIEASWVETPAFTGAVLRNILEPTEEISAKAAKVLSKPPKKWTTNGRPKAAVDIGNLMARMTSDARVAGSIEGGPFTSTDVLRVSAVGVPSDAFLAGWEDDVTDIGDEGGGDEVAPEAPQKSPLDEAEEELTTYLTDRVKKRVKDQLREKQVDKNLPDSSAGNDNLAKEASARVYQASLDTLVRVASSDASLIDGIAAMNQALGIDIPVSVYRAALKVGPVVKYGANHTDALNVYLAECKKVLGHNLSASEARTLIRLGKLLSLRGQDLRGNTKSLAVAK